MKYLLTLLLAFSFSVSAGPYLVGGIGDNQYDFSDDLDDVFGKHAQSMNLGVGYTFENDLSWLSVEFNHTDFGDTDKSFYYDVQVGGYYDGDYYEPEFVTVTENWDFDADSNSLWVVGDWDLAMIGGKQLQGSARVGVIDAKAKVKLMLSAEGESISDSDTDSDTGHGVGVGLKYWAGENTAVTLDYTEYDLAYNFFGESFDYDPQVWMLGVQHRF